MISFFSFYYLYIQEHIPSWREQLRHIGCKYMTPDYAQLITSATEWLDTAYCTQKKEYRKREKTLREAFGEMYTTRILEDPEVAQGRVPTPSGGRPVGKLGMGAFSPGRPGSPENSSSVRLLGSVACGVVMRPPSQSTLSSPSHSRASSPNIKRKDMR